MAARLLEGIWDAARKSRGLDDPETLRAGSRLARFKIDAGTTEEAARILDVVLPRSEAILGINHPTTREARDLLDLVLPDKEAVVPLPAEPFERAR